MKLRSLLVFGLTVVVSLGIRGEELTRGKIEFPTMANGNYRSEKIAIFDVTVKEEMFVQNRTGRQMTHNFTGHPMFDGYFVPNCWSELYRVALQMLRTAGCERAQFWVFHNFPIVGDIWQFEIENELVRYFRENSRSAPLIMGVIANGWHRLVLELQNVLISNLWIEINVGDKDLRSFQNAEGLLSDTRRPTGGKSRDAGENKSAEYRYKTNAAEPSLESGPPNGVFRSLSHAPLLAQIGSIVVLGFLAIGLVIVGLCDWLLNNRLWRGSGLLLLGLLGWCGGVVLCVAYTG